MFCGTERSGFSTRSTTAIRRCGVAGSLLTGRRHQSDAQPRQFRRPAAINCLLRHAFPAELAAVPSLRIALPLFLVVVVHDRVDDWNRLRQLHDLCGDVPKLLFEVVVVEPVGRGLQSLEVLNRVVAAVHPDDRKPI